MAIFESSTGIMKPWEMNISILSYGPPGSGKTRFAATMPDPYFISLDGGLKGLAVLGLKIPYVAVETYSDMVQVINEIKIGKRAVGRKSIIFDHLSEATDPIVRDVLGETSKKRMDLNTWGIAVDKLKYLVKSFVDLNTKFHINMIAHEQVEKDEIRGEIMGTPATIGKFAQSIGGMFNLFLYHQQNAQHVAGKQVPTFKIHTVSYGFFKAKDQLGVLDTIEDNDFNIIISKLKEASNAPNRTE
jgi:hypothetical protein